MLRALTVPLISYLVLFFGFSSIALAGFGITPPFVKNTSLTRNSIYQQQILLVRSDPTTALKATITVDAPGFEDWIEISQGTEFLLPKGEQKVPMNVSVTVPNDADFKEYTGTIRIKTGAPDDSVRSGAVSISLGAQVDIKLTVIDKEIIDFRVTRVTVSDLNEGHEVGWLYFPGKIKFGVTLENTGNVPVAPTDVRFKIYDVSGNILLEETRNKNKPGKIFPFRTGEVTYELPTRLPKGNYIARFEIYNGDEIKHEGALNLSILPYGTLQAAGFGFSGLSLPHKISIVLPILTLIFFVSFGIYTLTSKRRKKRIV